MVDCRFCKSVVEGSVVDIGGLKMCLPCYRTRSARTELPCTVCGTPVKITPSLLTTAVVCGSCEAKADLRKAWDDSKNKRPCDRCGSVTKYHHPSVYGQNLCDGCYRMLDCPCTQLYPGDMGYPAFATKPSVPALLLPTVETSGHVADCVVCGTGLLDPDGLVAELRLPTICRTCDGPKWWDKSDAFR